MPKRRSDPPEPWWVRRWLDLLDAFGDDYHTRLTKGRSYANSGRILDISVVPGLVAARARGSYGDIYAVRLDVPKLEDDAWARVATALAARADYVALLLGGNLPAHMGAVFDAVGAALFPNPRTFRSHCTCFDWANPCKHVFGLYYGFAELLRDDPSLLFALRGRSRDDLLRIIQHAWTGESVQTSQRPPTDAPAERPSIIGPLRLDRFFTPSAPLDALDTPIVPLPSESDGALIQRLGQPAFARETEDVVTPLARAYVAVSRRAVMTLKRSAAKHLLHGDEIPSARRIHGR